MKFFIQLFCILVSFSVYAIPANIKPITIQQSDGRMLTYVLYGDEFLNWAKTIDGYTLLRNSEKQFTYAILNKENYLVASNVIATNPNERNGEDILFLNNIRPNLQFSQRQNEKTVRERNENRENISVERIPTTGNPNFLVILVNFTDTTFNSNNILPTRNQISQSNYTSNGATGSVKDYFYDNSMGVFNPNFTVVGPYTLPHSQAYYGAESGLDHDVLARQFAYDAALLANNDVNFANFDNDGDGQVDMVHIIYAGRGQHNGGGANAIWAHSSIFPFNTSFDGVSLWSYSCSNELNYNLSCEGIGAICHEMGHVLGLPDFYDTDYSGSGGQAITLRDWDVMDHGGYNNNSKTPPYLNAKERLMLGWMNSTTNEIVSDSANFTLPSIGDSNKAYIDNISQTEYYIFEHRNQKKWDAYTPGKGMLVFHADQNLIDHWSIDLNDFNANPYNRGFFIIPASGDSTNIDSTNTTFPGTDNITSLTNLRFKNGNLSGRVLSNIGYTTDSLITFNYVNYYPDFTVDDATNITITSATISGSALSTGIISKGIQWKNIDSLNFNTQTISSSSTMQLALNNLNPSTIYEYRIFATKSSGTYYSEIKRFQTLCSPNAINLPYYETCEGSLPCWTYYASGNYNWEIVNSGYGPLCSPHTGSQMLMFDSYNTNSDEWASITSSQIYFPNNNYKISLWIYRHSSPYLSQNQYVSIYINSNPTLSGATLLGSISDNRNVSPTATSDGWYEYSVNIPSGITGNQYVKIIGFGDNNYYMYIDDISITDLDSLPCSNVVTNLSAYICQGETYTQNGFNVSTQGTYTQNLQTYDGCDSTVNLSLAVNNPILPSNLSLEMAGNHFNISWQGNSSTYVIYRNNDSIASVTSASYQDSNLINGNNYCYKIKAVEGNCESELSQEDCQTYIGLIDITTQDLKFYPNPAKDYLMIEGEKIEKIEVNNINGQLVESIIAKGEKAIKINTSNYNAGTYNVNIILSNGNKIAKKAVIIK
jgi:M6 family metalloprotease-like protein